MNRREFCSSLSGLTALAATPLVAKSQEVKSGLDGKPRLRTKSKMKALRYDIPRAWRRSGLIIQRSMSGPGSGVVGDPCIVRDDDIDGWRMFLFFAPPGCGHAV